jgi:VanZ family protein
MGLAGKALREPGTRRAWVWPVALAALIFAYSSRPSAVDLDSWWSSADKMIHFAVYGLLAILICRIGRGWHAAILGALLAAAYGATDEWHQSFVPGRSAEFADWLADALGAVVAAWIYAGSDRVRSWIELPARRRKTALRPTGAPTRAP